MTMENTNAPAETEIDLKDMFIYCFLHWRSALVLCLIFGLLIGAVQGYRSYKSTVASNAAAQKQIETQIAEEAAEAEKEAEKSPDEAALDLAFVSSSESLQNAVGRAARITRLKNNVVDVWNAIQSQEKFIKESAMMKLDPDNLSKTISSIMISAASSNDTFDPGILLPEYKNELFYSGTLAQIARSETLGMKESDILPLIEFSYPYPSYQDKSIYSEKSGSDSALFYISAKGRDASASEEIMSSLLSALPLAQQKISASTGVVHSVSVLSTYTVTTSDDSIKAYQETQKQKLESLYTKFDQAQDNLTKALSSKEDTAAEKELSQSTEEKIAVVITSPLKAFAKNTVKWSVIGAVIVFLLYGLFLCILYALGRPKTLSSLSGRFPLRLLGGIRDAEKKLYNGKTRFDGWLRKMAGINPERDEEKVYDMISSNLSVFCGEEESFIIAGSDTKEHREILCRELSRRMPKKTFTAPSDILSDPASRNLLGECDAIIFSEIYGKCTNRGLQEELSLISGTGIKVAGMITQ